MKKIDGTNAAGSTDAFDPINFMRARRPDEYSDSRKRASQQLSATLLEYHLETLTNRNQENEFAYFARRLAAKELCPNLRPQTGPTGGGDSKVDSETVPLSGELAMLWVGTDPTAAKERWAFAFSAKKDWKSKVASDVRNIASTGRPYNRIYFITSRFAPEKSRAQSEDSLSEEVGIPVYILDRSWITTAVLEHGHADIAIEALHIDDLRSTIGVDIGPEDLRRQQELDALESVLADPLAYGDAKYQQAEDALRAATLARGLERTRVEVDGLFVRAERLAKALGSEKQRLRVAYAYAWTALFWFDDVVLLNTQYDTVEAIGLASTHMEEVDLVHNLWMVLSSQVQRGVISADDAFLNARLERLSQALETLAADVTRPNNALRARTASALLAAQERMSQRDAEGLDRVWDTLSAIAVEAEHLGDYPFERLARIVEEMSEIGVDGERFDVLFESVVHALEKRRGEVTSAEMLSDRGAKKLEVGKFRDAITLFGRAMERFVKHESRRDLIFCLGMLSSAYGQMGLHWAARSSILTACDRALTYFHEEGRIAPFALTCLRGLVEAELHLGRVSQVMASFELANLIAPQVLRDDEARIAYTEFGQLTEAMLGILLLASTLPQLQAMSSLPEVFEQQGLSIAKAMLLYALGYVDELRDEGFPEDRWSVEDIHRIMQGAFSQPGRLQMPSHPQIEDEARVRYRTTILGCRVTLETDASHPGIALAEAVLSTLEAFLATSLDESIMPYRPTARIVLEASEAYFSGLDTFVDEDEGSSYLRIRYPAQPEPASLESRGQFRQDLMEIALTFIAHVAVVPDMEAYLARIAGDERGFARAIMYAESSVTQSNVFGEERKLLVRDWHPPAGARTYPVRRTTEWYAGLPIVQLPLTDVARDAPLPIAGASLAREARRASERSHAARRIVSPIDIPLWDQAKWQGVLYMGSADDEALPAFGFMFSNPDAGMRIFRGWRQMVGEHDAEDTITIVVIRGIFQGTPSAYRVLIRGNLHGEGEAADIVATARHHTMIPTTTVHLDRFLDAVKHQGSYELLPAFIASPSAVPEIIEGVAIRKDHIVVRHAWEIGMRDEDCGGIRPEDDPIIPDDVTDAPVLKLLERLRQQERE